MKKLGEVIRSVRKSQGETIAEVADAVPGYDAGNLSRFETGKQDITQDKLETISKILDTPISTMYKMAESGFKSGSQINQEIPEYNVKESVISIKKCPVISWVKAGEMCDPCHVSSFDEAEDWLICGTPHSDKTYALLIVGDSMAPEYQEGWHIFVDPEIQAKHNDDVIVRDEQGKATFKRLQITPEGQYLLALNPDHPQRKIQVPEGSTICGVVIYSGRKRR